MAKQTKIELYKEAQTFGRDASFIANVIFCHHKNPAKKLAGLVAILRSGQSVSLASFDIDTLQIDGAGRFAFSHLETFTAKFGRKPTQDEATFMARRTQEAL
jgi:hypothetical protein